METQQEPAPALYTDKADTKIWLTKVPKFIANKWNNINQPGVELGTIRIYKPLPGAKKNPRKDKHEITLHLPKEAEWAADIPKNFNLNLSNTDNKANYVFTTSAKNPLCQEISGKIFHEANCTPIYDDDYRKLTLDRNVTASQPPSNTVKIIDDKTGKSVMFVPHKQSKDESGFSSLKKKPATLDKKERLPEQELLDILFSAFEELEHWTFKALMDLTMQPQVYLKEVLGRVAVFVKEGAYRDTWKIKEEYRNKTKSGDGKRGMDMMEED